MSALVKDTNFNMRINRQKKADLEGLYSRLGMTLPEAVNIFFEKNRENAEKPRPKTGVKAADLGSWSG